MALPATTQWEIRTTGNANNGGGFNAERGGVDYSQQDSAEVAITEATSSGSDLASASNPFTSSMVGNVIYVVSGTNFIPGFYEIVSFTSAGLVTLDRDPASGSGSGGVVNVGGAQSDLQAVSDSTGPGQKVWLKAGTYTLTSSFMPTQNGTDDQRIAYIGYNSIRGDGFEPCALLDAAFGDFTIMDLGASVNRYLDFSFISFQRSHTVNFRHGVAGGRNCRFYRCSSYDNAGYAWLLPYGSMVMIQCESANWCPGYDTARMGYSLGSYCTIVGCIAYMNGTRTNDQPIAYRISQGSVFDSCIAYNCGIGFEVLNYNDYLQTLVKNCVAYGCYGDGFRNGHDYGGAVFSECFAVNNGGYAMGCYSTHNSNTSIQALYHYGNGGGLVQQPDGTGSITYWDGESNSLIELDADPFVDPSNLDFSIRPNAITADGKILAHNSPYNTYIVNRLAALNGYKTPGPSGVLPRRVTVS